LSSALFGAEGKKGGIKECLVEKGRKGGGIGPVQRLYLIDREEREIRQIARGDKEWPKRGERTVERVIVCRGGRRGEERLLKPGGEEKEGGGRTDHVVPYHTGSLGGTRRRKLIQCRSRSVGEEREEREEGGKVLRARPALSAHSLVQGGEGTRGGG